MEKEVIDNGTLQGVFDMAELIGEYGSAIVIISVFLVIFIITIVIILKQSQKKTNAMMTENQTLVAGLIDQNNRLMESILNTKSQTPQKEYDEENIVEIFVKLNSSLKEECMTVLNRIDNTIRVGIYVFHNGNTSSHGVPFIKMSCVCEWIERGIGIQPRGGKDSSLPLNIFDEIVHVLYSNGSYTVEGVSSSTNVENINFAAGFLKIKDSNKLTMVSIHDTNHKLMGFILVEYANNGMELCKIEEEIFKVAEKVAPVLEFSNFQNIST